MSKEKRMVKYSVRLPGGGVLTLPGKYNANRGLKWAAVLIGEAHTDGFMIPRMSSTYEGADKKRRQVASHWAEHLEDYDPTVNATLRLIEHPEGNPPAPVAESEMDEAVDADFQIE